MNDNVEREAFKKVWPCRPYVYWHETMKRWVTNGDRLLEAHAYNCRWQGFQAGRNAVIEEFFKMGRMILCEICGNKRCPHATNNENACTNSNDPGQPGSKFSSDVLAETVRKYEAELATVKAERDALTAKPIADNLHAVICEAVIRMNIGEDRQAGDILREALANYPNTPPARAEEPVAYRFTENCGNGKVEYSYYDADKVAGAYRDNCLEITPLYTSPPLPADSAALREQIAAGDALRISMADVPENILDWASYASEHFQEKYGMQDDVDRYKKALAAYDAAIAGSETK